MFQNERDRKYNTTYEFKKPTELEVEAYKLTQVRSSRITLLNTTEIFPVFEITFIKETTSYLKTSPF